MTCKRCGKCCSYEVCLTDDEVQRGLYKCHYSRHWDEVIVDRDDFGRGRHKMGGQCVYLRGTRCSIYRGRPQACRDFRCDKSL